MISPKISICIPTYNREEHLRVLLDSIVLQTCFSEDIEIFIYDDPSSDNTESMVWEYTKKYSNIRYHRNTVRAGMMPSILDSILQCSWEYIWLFGSDDIMGPFWLRTMLQLINEQKPDIILNNYQDANLGINYQESNLQYDTYSTISAFCNSLTKHKKIIPPTIGTIPDMYHYISYFSYMSIYCFRRDLFHKSYDRMLENWKYDYLQSHYFNYIFILFTGGYLNKICLCQNPTLTYNKSWGAAWKFSLKILRDVMSIFYSIGYKNRISISTIILFWKLYIIWYGWYIYNSKFISFLKTKHFVLYSALYKFVSKNFIK